MKIDAPNLNHLWAQLIVEELVRHGVGHFFVAPGSRSSPLALAAALRCEGGDRRPPALHTHFDERGLAFAALGCARATGRPAVVITTSGTAVANLLPAVVEASLEQIPMVLLTGDRPPELRDCGANQSIDQVKIFGGYVRWFFDLPCPATEISPRFVLGTVDQAFAQAQTGPVHLNCQFREPLAPSIRPYDRKGIEVELRRWLAASGPSTRGNESAAMTTHGWLMEEILPRRTVRGVIMTAGLANAQEVRAVQQLAEAAGWPLLADLRSGLRGRAPDAIRHADHLLLSETFTRKMKPDVVLQFGSRPVSKRIQQWIDAVRPRVYAVVAPGADRLDPGLSVTHRWLADVAWTAQVLRQRLRATGSPRWMKSWQRADAAAAGAIERVLATDTLSEPGIARVVLQTVAPDCGLVFANSMPVRDAEMYGGAQGAPAFVIANRGASGIDGTVATAAGASLGSGKPVTLVIGDLSLLHDLNSLALLRQVKRSFVVVAINNDGGGIFHFLPVANHPAHFEQLFGMPHGLRFRAAAEMFGLAYAQPVTASEFERAYGEACRRPGATLLEVRTDRAENLQVHRRLQNAVRTAVDRIVR